MSRISTRPLVVKVFLVELAIAVCLAIAVLIAAPANACAPDLVSGEVKLSPAEVRSTFIGTPWHGPDGAFIFREEGTYSYKDFGNSQPRGTWSYIMLEDGTLEGSSTTYTFFRSGNSFRYFHGRSCKYYRAIPNRSY